MSTEESAVDSLKKKGWASPISQENILSSLQGKRLGSYKLLPLIGPKNKFGATYFQVFLQNTLGEIGQQPVVIGLYNRGSYPAYNWIEIISLAPQVDFGSGEQVFFSISSGRLTQQLFKYLTDLLPPGGHMMVEYDSSEQQDTARSLASGIPPIATPLGYTLFLAGCSAGFRDWYFAEGGSEGPRKLQGYKLLNSQHTKQKIEEVIKELSTLLDKLSSKDTSELERAAQSRALDILNRLKQQNESEDSWDIPHKRTRVSRM